MKRKLAFTAATAFVFAVLALTTRVALAQADPPGAPVTVDGILMMLVEDDWVGHHANKRYFLDEPGVKKKHELKLGKHQEATLQPGMKVRVTGRFKDDVLNADGLDENISILDVVAATAPTASRKVLVLLVNIKDANNVVHAISSNCDGSIDKAAAITFGYNTTAANVDGCYQDSSYGKLGFGGTSYPGTDIDVQRVTITDSVTACNYTAWGSKADALATNLASYQNRVYVVPSDVACGWAGLAYVNSCPGSYCQSWVKAYGGQECGYIDGVAHEVGHNLGLMHSSTDPNNDGTIDCEYCDDSDFMGYAEGTLRPSNGPHRIQMGWLSGGQVIDASAGGQFTLAPLSQWAAPLPQVAKITPQSGHPYYVSYRVAAGYDSFIANTIYQSSVLNRISIHRWPGGVNNTRLITSLADGQSFVDAGNSITIQQNSHSATSVTFTVSAAILAPNNLIATAGNGQVSLSWNATAGATSYKVKRSTINGGPFTTLATVTSNSYLDTAVVNGTPYYYVVSAVSGAGESVNSAQATATPNGIDLVTTAVSNPPATAAPGSTFSVTDTVRNSGAVTSAASTTRYYVSGDLPKDGGDSLLAATRSVPSLAAGATSSGTVTVTIPASLPAGSYYLLSCADDLVTVGETNELNNCMASATKVNVSLPDLLLTALSMSTTAVAAGATVSVTDTVANQGAAAGAFSTRYYLSLDQLKGGGDVLLTQMRSFASLAAGASSSGSVSVTIPASTPAGSYYIVGCADDANTVAESNDTNNCRASAGTLPVTLADLVVTAVTIPATPVAVGGTIKVNDTVKNQGIVTAAASTTRYYISADLNKDGADILLTGTDAVASLAAGASSSDQTTVTIPPNAAFGTYYVLSCSDDTNTVNEQDETNNCRASTTSVQVTGGDLAITAINNPPASVTIGKSFRMTDTVKNQGTVTAAASANRYYLSTDRSRSADDLLLTGTRSINSINAGSSSSGNVNVTAPAGTLQGTYYIIGCADDLSVVGETDETNNCSASTSTTSVQ